MEKVAAPAECFPDDEHAKKKEHYIETYRICRIREADLAGEKNNNRSKKHDLPDPELQPANLAHRDQDKYQKKHDDRKVGREIRESAYCIQFG